MLDGHLLGSAKGVNFAHTLLVIIGQGVLII
jgi:hypothetical protein